MAMPDHIGARVTIRGINLTVKERVRITEGKNFGKVLFRLDDENGRMYSAMGKHLTSNSRITAHSIF